MKNPQESEAGGRRRKLPDADGSGKPFLLTVVTVVYNGVKDIERTIRSVIEQTYWPVEYIIIDGGSTDGTVEIIRSYEDSIDFWLSGPDRGVYDAFNKSCSHIHGEWILFLGAGDVLNSPDVLEHIARAAGRVSSETELVFGRVCVTNEQGDSIEILNGPWAEMRGKWCGGRPVFPHHQGIFHRRTLLAQGTPFDIGYRIAADSKLVYQSTKRVDPHFCDIVLTRSPLGGISTNPKQSLATAKEIVRINRELGHRGYVHQVWFFLKALSKSLLLRSAGESFLKASIDLYRSATGRNPKWTR